MPSDNPTTMSIQDIYEEWFKNKRESLFLPAFQRDFVWNWTKVKEFFESIINGYPVGEIILWEVSREEIENDEFKRPLIDEMKPNEKNYYVFDGQQRLTSLMLLFNNWKIKRGEEDIDLSPICVDRNLKLGKKGVNLFTIIKKWWDDDEEAEKEWKNLDKSFRNKLRELQSKIKKYKIPIYIISDKKDLQEMADAFIRINRAGVRIRGPELTLLLWVGRLGKEVGGIFRKEIARLDKKYGKRKEENDTVNLDLSVLARFILSGLPNFKQTQISHPERLKRKIEEVGREKIEQIIYSSEKAIDETLEFLEKELGIADLKFIPSQVTLIPIAYYFRKTGENYKHLKEVKPYEIRKMKKWFILANFFGRYSSQTDRKLQDDLDEIDKSTEFPFNSLIEKLGREEIGEKEIKKGLEKNVYREGKEYLFLLYILLVHNRASDWKIGELRGRKYKDLHIHHIFPQKKLREYYTNEGKDKDEIEIIVHNLGNLTWIDKDKNSEIDEKEPEEYFKELSEEDLKGHFIESTDWSYTTFESQCRLRVDRICEMWKQFWNTC